MAIYLKKFETQSAYEAAESSLILPNVSLTVDNNTVHYNPSSPVPPTPVETRVVAKFNVTDTSNPTPIGYNQYISGFSTIEIDGVEQPSVVSAYTFSTTGEHTVKYYLNGTSIGYMAFQSCKSLTSVTIGSGVTSIGDYAFASCSGLTSINIPNGVTSIGNYAFTYCFSLASVTIGSGVTSISYGAFRECYGLTSITVDNSNNSYSSENGVLFNKSKTTLIHYPIGNSRETYSVPNSVTNIGECAFSECYGLTSITIVNGVTSIGDEAFYECGNLESIDIPDSVTSIGNSAFYNCNALTSATIGSGVTSIGDEAFCECGNLESIYVSPSEPPYLGSSAFDNTNGCPIYVSDAETYKEAYGWSNYEDRIQ